MIKDGGNTEKNTRLTEVLSVLFVALVIMFLFFKILFD